MLPCAPLYCDKCGTTNRSQARFCVGCRKSYEPAPTILANQAVSPQLILPFSLILPHLPGFRIRSKVLAAAKTFNIPHPFNILVRTEHTWLVSIFFREQVSWRLVHGREGRDRESVSADQLLWSDR